MERELVKSFGDLLQNQYGTEYSSDWAVQEFAKAVATGSGLSLNGANMGDASPLMLQNLDNVLTSVLFTEEHFELFGSLPRKASMNLIYQFDKRLKYGGGRRSPGFVEGGSPLGGVSQWERDSATIRFFGVRRGITHQLMRVGELGGSQLDPVAEENRNGTLQLLEEMERYIFFGDQTIKDNAGRIVGYDGIRKQIQNSPVASTNYIDMLGQPLGFENLEDFAQMLVENYYVTSFKDLKTLCSPGVIADFSKLNYNINRHLVSSGKVDGMMMGLPFKGYSSNFGDIPFKRHLFFQRVKGDAPIATGEGADPGSPAVPVTVTATPTNDATSKQDVGTVYYVVSSVDDHGESLVCAPVSAVIAAAQRVDVAITAVTGATSYRVYRGVKSDGSDAKWIADVAAAASGATTLKDLNQKRPGTGTMLLWMNEESTIVVPQFMPLLRWPIAITTTTVEWFLLLYHTVVLKAPQRAILVENIGRLS